MLQKIKKLLAISTIVVLFPYIFTIFMNGKEAQEEILDERDALLKQHCIGVLAKEVSSDYEDEMLKYSDTDIYDPNDYGSGALEVEVDDECGFYSISYGMHEDYETHGVWVDEWEVQ